MIFLRPYVFMIHHIQERGLPCGKRSGSVNSKEKEQRM